MSKLLFAAGLFLLTACRPASDVAGQQAATATSQPSPTHPAVVLPDGAVVAVELATDDDTRQQGLMYRESLEPLKGMLFIFPAAGDYPFWMKNTMIPLDMLWIDDSRHIVHIEQDVPPCTADPCPSYPPGAKAKYVLELKAGEAAAHHLQNGAMLQMRNIDGVQVR